MNAEPTNSELIEAMNMLCEHVQSNLPAGWTIRLDMSSIEATLELLDHEDIAHEIECHTFISPVNSMIDYAGEERQDAEEEKG